MKNYIIYEKEMGILSRTKGSVSDKEGNKRRHLVYWANEGSNEAMKFFYITAVLQKIMINIFAKDLNPIVIKQDALTRSSENE